MSSDKATEDILMRTKQRSREIEELLLTNDDSPILALEKTSEKFDKIKAAKEFPLTPLMENQMDTPKASERRSRFAALSAQVDEFECDLKAEKTLSRKENLLKGPPRKISVGADESKSSVLVNYCVPVLSVPTTKLTQAQKPSTASATIVKTESPILKSTVSTTMIKAPTKVIQEPSKAITHRQLSTSRVIRPDPANVKKLLSRWEVSSQIGVPLHPDRNNEELLNAAVHLAYKTVKPLKTAVKRNFGSANNSLSYHEIVSGDAVNSSTTSQRIENSKNYSDCVISASKSPRIEGYSSNGTGNSIIVPARIPKVDMIVEEDQVDSMCSNLASDAEIDFSQSIKSNSSIEFDEKMSYKDDIEFRPIPNNPKRLSISNNSINASVDAIDLAFSFISEKNESAVALQNDISNKITNFVSSDGNLTEFDGELSKTPDKVVETESNNEKVNELVEKNITPVTTIPTSIDRVEALRGVGGQGTEQRKTEFITSLIDDINKDLEKYTPTFRRPLNEEEECGLTHTISFYRRQANARRLASKNLTDSDDTQKANFDLTSSSGSTTGAGGTPGAIDSFLNPTVEVPLNNEATLKHLHEAIIIQQDQISQASRALAFCQQNENFKGSREEVDAQRALLIATERRRAFIYERDRIMNMAKSLSSSKDATISYAGGEPRGTLIFSFIAIRLSRDFINLYMRQNSADVNRYYFIVLIKYGENVVHTTLENSDHGIKSGFIEFSPYIQLAGLKPDFVCTLEVYSLRTPATHISQDKHSLTEKSKKKSHWMKTLSTSSGATVISNLGSSSSAGSYSKPPTSLSITSPAFQKIGYINLTRSQLGREKFLLMEPLYPLDGNLVLNLRCHAEATLSLNHSGFLSLYQTVSNLASWTRFWSVLSNGQIRFWRYPEDEEKKKPVVCLELTQCLSDVTDVSSSTATFPHSMQVDVALKEEGNDAKDIRMVFAANSYLEKMQWMEAINQSIRNVNIWKSSNNRDASSALNKPNRDD